MNKKHSRKRAKPCKIDDTTILRRYLTILNSCLSKNDNEDERDKEKYRDITSTFSAVSIHTWRMRAYCNKISRYLTLAIRRASTNTFLSKRARDRYFCRDSRAHQVLACSMTFAHSCRVCVHTAARGLVPLSFSVRESYSRHLCMHLCIAVTFFHPLSLCVCVCMCVRCLSRSCAFRNRHLLVPSVYFWAHTPGYAIFLPYPSCIHTCAHQSVTLACNDNHIIIMITIMIIITLRSLLSRAQRQLTRAINEPVNKCTYAYVYLIIR